MGCAEVEVGAVSPDFDLRLFPGCFVMRARASGARRFLPKLEVFPDSLAMAIPTCC